MRVYIAGKIEGDPNYREKFREAEEKLTKIGHTPLNPAWQQSGFDNRHYMRVCLAMMESADAVYFLPDWQESNGARLEKAWCEYVGMKMYFGRI